MFSCLITFSRELVANFHFSSLPTIFLSSCCPRNSTDSKHVVCAILFATAAAPPPPECLVQQFPKQAAAFPSLRDPPDLNFFKEHRSLGMTETSSRDCPILNGKPI